MRRGRWPRITSCTNAAGARLKERPFGQVLIPPLYQEILFGRTGNWLKGQVGRGWRLSDSSLPPCHCEKRSEGSDEANSSPMHYHPVSDAIAFYRLKIARRCHPELVEGCALGNWTQAWHIMRVKAFVRV